MAGSFGFEQAHFDVSQAVGERVLLPAVRQADPRTLVIADGFSCREQIAQGTGRRALHIAQVLKMAIDNDAFAASDECPERRYVCDHSTAVLGRRQLVGTALVTVGIFLLVFAMRARAARRSR